MVQENTKFDTLLSREYQMRYEPSACEINPSFKIIEHKARPFLHEVTRRYRYRRSLSALLNSKPIDPLLDKNHSAMNTLNNFESDLQQKVSAAAPTKEHQPLAALRQGRDPRMNKVNAHFDAEHARMNKENQGFNMGRHPPHKRPTTAVIAWRPRKPFLTFEKAFNTKGQQQVHDAKRLHAKIMNDCIQTNNLKSVPEHLLPTGELAWVKPAKPLVRSKSQDFEPNSVQQEIIKNDGNA